MPAVKRGRPAKASQADREDLHAEVRARSTQDCLTAQQTVEERTDLQRQLRKQQEQAQSASTRDRTGLTGRPAGQREDGQGRHDRQGGRGEQ